MNCPVCGLTLELKGVEDCGDYSMVKRHCQFCRAGWTLKHQDNSVLYIVQAGKEDLVGKFGFDYKCPYCRLESSVYTVFQPKTGWKCLNCGRIIPNESITPRGDFVPIPAGVQVSGGSSRSARRRQRSGDVQRTPRTSRPTPAGAVSVSAVAAELGIEPKKLRSWLRKVNWRSEEESRSQWLFSPEEVKDVISNFRK